MKKYYKKHFFLILRFVLIFALFISFGKASLSQTVITNIYDTACQNDPYYIIHPNLPPNLSPGNHLFPDTLTAINGNDSIVNLFLTIHPIYNTTKNISICFGDSLVNAGIYIDTLQTIYGCDSIVTTNITIIQPVVFTQAITFCDSIGNSGVFIDSLIAANGCDSIVYTMVTFVPPLIDSVSSIYSNNIWTLTAHTHVSNLTYNWSGPCIVSGSITANPIVNCAGCYTVTVTNSQNGCTSTAVHCVNPVSVEDNIKNSIFVYPNPSNGIVEFSGIKNGSQLLIIDITGKIIYTNKIVSEKYKINLSDKAKGIYFYKMDYEGIIYDVGKLIIK